MHSRPPRRAGAPRASIATFIRATRPSVSPFPRRAQLHPTAPASGAPSMHAARSLAPLPYSSRGRSPAARSARRRSTAGHRRPPPFVAFCLPAATTHRHATAWSRLAPVASFAMRDRGASRPAPLARTEANGSRPTGAESRPNRPHLQGRPYTHRRGAANVGPTQGHAVALNAPLNDGGGEAAAYPYGPPMSTEKVPVTAPASMRSITTVPDMAVACAS
jgi:hypothetical protein